jgi:TRAP transporter TAXI family solute receptor
VIASSRRRADAQGTRRRGWWFVPIACAPAPAILIATLAMLAALPAAGCQAPAPAPKRSALRIATGAPGGGFQPLGDALAKAIGAAMPETDITVQFSAGAVSNVEAIQSGTADVALSFSDVAYIASVGRLEGKPQPFTRLRAIAVLQLTPVHLVVGKQSGITQVADLRGKRVGLGPPGSGTVLTAGLVLKAFGLELDAVHGERLGFDEAANRVRAGTLDAMFDNATYPVSSARTATEAGASLIPLEGPAMERLRREYPFLRVTSIPRGTYPHQADPIHTIGVDSLLVCRNDLDERLVYDFTQRLFEVLPAVSTSQTSLRFMDLEQAPAAPIALHEGAARYYREREFTR